MNENRIALLRQMEASDPNDPFIPYAIAQEYLGGGFREEAERALAELLQRFPDYVPAYQHLGATCMELGWLEKAKSALEKGIKIAQQQGNRKAAGEMANLLEEVEDQLD